MNTRLFVLAIACVVTLACQSASCSSSDKEEPKCRGEFKQDGLVVTIKPTKASYSTGEWPEFDVTLKNESNKPLQVALNYGHYTCWAIKVTDTATKKSVNLVRPSFDDKLDYVKTFKHLALKVKQEETIRLTPPSHVGPLAKEQFRFGPGEYLIEATLSFQEGNEPPISERNSPAKSLTIRTKVIVEASK